MPPGELAACIEGCGAWVTAEAAQTLLLASELRPSRITSWFREPCSCPVCGTQMTLCGHDMSLFQGCDSHGFWIDESTIAQTNFAHPMHASRVAQMRAAAKALREEIERREAEERARLAEEPIVRARREAEQQTAKRAAREAAEGAAREAELVRERVLREERRQRYAMLVQAAVEGDVLPLVDELVRLDETITALESRVAGRR
jgi:hypothetical protein